MRRRHYLKLVPIAALPLAGCASDDPDDSDSGEANGDSDGGDSDSDGSDGGDSDSSDQDVKLLSHEWYEEDFSAGVKGTAKNVSGEELSYVQVEVAFYDSDGAKIEDGLDNTSDLPADTEWKFDAGYIGSDPETVDDYEIEVDTGF